MANPILKEVTVPIPEDGNVVIRNGKRVEYQLDRVYSPETKDSRVARRVIGKVDPVQPGRMFPNEMYFELFPDNEVPEEIRDEFLRDCAIKRDMGVIRQNPEEIVDKVVRGLDALGREEGRRGQGNPDLSVGWAGEDGANRPIRIGPASSDPTGPGPGYAMIRRVFDEIYFAIEELAGKFPNEVIDPYKVERINEVLLEVRGLSGIGVERLGRWGQGKPDLSVGWAGEDGANRPIRIGPASSVPTGPSVPAGPGQYLRLIEEGLTYSDVLLMLKWYKVLPR